MGSGNTGKIEERAKRDQEEKNSVSQSQRVKDNTYAKEKKSTV